MRWWETVAGEAGGEREEEERSEDGPVTLPAALHAQFGHSVRVGNQAYGGTINFQEDLTDAGLQEYRRVSWWWHRFVQSPRQPRQPRQPRRRPGWSSLPTAGIETGPVLSHRRRPAECL
jgi:hypothetical protein